MSQVSGGTGYNYTHLSGAGTTTILAGIGATQGSATAPANVGLLGGVSVNTAGTTVTINDGSNTLAVLGAVTGQFLQGPIQLKNGLSVVIVGAADVTVAWA